ESPEKLARQNIDIALKLAGWVVQDAKAANISAGRGVAVREFPPHGDRISVRAYAERPATQRHHKKLLADVAYANAVNVKRKRESADAREGSRLTILQTAGRY